MPLSRPVCVKCETEFRVEKNGILVIDSNEDVYEADMWKCPKCNFRITHGYGSRPVVFKGQTDYDSIVADLKKGLDPEYIVNIK